MSKRLPRPKLLRGLIKRNIIRHDDASVQLINSKLDDPVVYRQLNEYYSQNGGKRWVNRFKVWADWLFKNREAIFQILGLVIMFADDGSPVVRDVKDVEAEQAKTDDTVTVETVHSVKEDVVVPDTTPSGEPVIEPEAKGTIGSSFEDYYGLGIAEKE